LQEAVPIEIAGQMEDLASAGVSISEDGRSKTARALPEPNVDEAQSEANSQIFHASVSEGTLATLRVAVPASRPISSRPKTVSPLNA
jgi:hypothetical protein